MLDKNDGYFLRLMRILLLPSGITVHQEYKKYRIPYICVFFCFIGTGLCGIAAALFIPNAPKIQIMETVFAMNIGFNVLMVFIVQQTVRKKLLDLYYNVQYYYLANDTFARLSDHQVMAIMDKKWIIVCTYMCFSAPPFIIISTTDIGIEDMRALNFPLVCPWKTDTVWKYLLTLGIEVTATTVAVTLSFAGIGTIYCYLVAIRSYKEIIKEDFKECFNSGMKQPRVKERFIVIIKKHQDLMK